MEVVSNSSIISCQAHKIRQRNSRIFLRRARKINTITIIICISNTNKTASTNFTTTRLVKIIIKQRTHTKGQPCKIMSHLILQANSRNKTHRSYIIEGLTSISLSPSLIKRPEHPEWTSCRLVQSKKSIVVMTMHLEIMMQLVQRVIEVVVEQVPMTFQSLCLHLFHH